MRLLCSAREQQTDNIEDAAKGDGYFIQTGEVAGYGLDSLD